MPPCGWRLRSFPPPAGADTCCSVDNPPAWRRSIAGCHRDDFGGWNNSQLAWRRSPQEWLCDAEQSPACRDESISANGVIEFVDDWFHSSEQGDEEDLSRSWRADVSEEALLLGRKTFEEFLG